MNMVDEEEQLGIAWLQMSEFERNNWLATRIMGWRSDRDLTPGAEYVYWFDGLKRLMLIDEWQPATIQEHALSVACKLRDKGAFVSIDMFPQSSVIKERFSCQIDDPVLDGYAHIRGDDLAEVIGECVWEIYGE